MSPRQYDKLLKILDRYVSSLETRQKNEDKRQDDLARTIEKIAGAFLKTLGPNLTVVK